MQTNVVLNSMLKEFDGCDSGDAGSPEAPSIWLFGIEPGHSRFDQQKEANGHAYVDDGYSVAKQLTWTFNRNAFKLLAAINGYDVKQYREFGYAHQPFVRGCKGYFKGNLYPYACNNVSAWPDEAARETGLTSKSEYQSWCREFRWPTIKKWLDKYQPKLFIGVGNSFREEFALSVFGRSINWENRSLSINGHAKNIFCAALDGRKLAVIPHLSGGRNGLNSNRSLEQAGEIIKALMRRQPL